MAEKRCYYEVLGVSRTATEVEITKAYRQLAKQYHPDRNIGDDEAKAKYAEVDEAYSVLNDQAKRARYDRHGHAGVEGIEVGGAGGDIGDLLQDFINQAFGGGGRARGPRGPRRGQSIAALLEIDLLEAATGTSKTFNVPVEQICRECGGNGAKTGTQPAQCRRCRGQKYEVVNSMFGFSERIACRGCGGNGVVITDPCLACRGAGRIEVQESVTANIPAGVDNDSPPFVYPGRGHAGDPGGPRGDLELHVRVRKHPTFDRNGHNLICQCKISFARAALGGPVEIATLTGEKVTIDVPRGSQTHSTVIRVPGHGMPGRPDARRASDQKGDLLVQLIVETPTKLSAEQEALYKQLAALEGAQVPGPQKGIFGKLKDLVTGEHPPKDEKK